MKVVRRARCSDADAAAGVDIDAAGRSAGPDPERQLRTAGDIADEEVGFIAGNVRVLLESNRRSITGIRVYIQHWRPRPEPEPARASYPNGIGRRSGVDFQDDR